ncbi:tRNA pseudouridine synthase A-like isoform X2 [Rhinatrema bivittatum]|nr:tRNA pseudouridine synthase A-like isoform X2 [Rhinatrema bivittatum]
MPAGLVKEKMRKFALQMAYNGGGYYGMQRHPGRADLPTIEDILLSALIKAQCVPESSAMDPRELHFQRCSRTDKGVSAVGQLVSTKLIATNQNMVEKINAHLPAEIRILGVTRMTRSFNSKTFCDARTYSYTLPTFALSRCQAVPDPGFRLPREDFHCFSQLLSFYQGTRKFHNFTRRRAALDPGATRCILSTACQEPFVRHGHEFIAVEVTGQSFMLHQIRKMMGLAIGTARGLLPDSVLPESVQPDRVFKIASAPALGLVLEKTHYQRYNSRFGGDGFHQPLNWEDVEPVASWFRDRHILPTIIQGELEELSMALWLQHVTQHKLLEMH